MNLKKLRTLIPDYTSGTLATVCNNAPELRSWQLQFITENRIYFATSNLKQVYKEIVDNPNISFSCNVNGLFFRISGTAVFEKNPSIRQLVFNHLDLETHFLYKDVNDNGFTVFYLEHGTIKYSDGFIPFEQSVF